MMPNTEHFDEAQQRAAALADAAFEVRFLTDTINYLQGIVAHKRSILKGAVEQLGQKSSTKLVPGVTLKLTPFEILVCSCHKDDAMACPAVGAGVPVSFEIRVNGTYLGIEYGDEYTLPLEQYDGPAPLERAA